MFSLSYVVSLYDALMDVVFKTCTLTCLDRTRAALSAEHFSDIMQGSLESTAAKGFLASVSDASQCRVLHLMAVE